MEEVKAIANNEPLGSFWKFKGADSTVDNFLFMVSPFPVLLIWMSYMLFVLIYGPKLMENRPAFKLRNVLLVYNSLQVAIAFYIVIAGVSGMYDYGIVEKGYCFIEIPDKKEKMKLLWGHYVFLIAKVTELLDTVFFVLRKKWSQVTFLHIYHHSLMCLATWLILKYEPTFSLIFLGTINSFVHVFMYTYYGLSAFPNLAKHLWWKKYITKMQLVQFMLVIVHTIWNWNVTTCPVSYILLSALAGNLLLFIYLYTDFYIKKYNKVKVNNENELKKQF